MTLKEIRILAGHIYGDTSVRRHLDRRDEQAIRMDEWAKQVVAGLDEIIEELDGVLGLTAYQQDKAQKIAAYTSERNARRAAVAFAEYAQ